MAKLQAEVSYWDKKLDAKLQGFREEFRAKLISEMTSLFECFLGKSDAAIKVPPISKDKGKSILGAPPGFPPKETDVDAHLDLMEDVGTGKGEKRWFHRWR